jgi:hypothetical protein
LLDEEGDVADYDIGTIAYDDQDAAWCSECDWQGKAREARAKDQDVDDV